MCFSLSSFASLPHVLCMQPQCPLFCSCAKRKSGTIYTCCPPHTASSYFRLSCKVCMFVLSSVTHCCPCRSGRSIVNMYFCLCVGLCVCRCCVCVCVCVCVSVCKLNTHTFSAFLTHRVSSLSGGLLALSGLKDNDTCLTNAAW